jgi:hypothetical protein
MEAFPVSFAEIGDPTNPDAPLVYQPLGQIGALIPKGRRHYMATYQRILQGKTTASTDYTGPSTESSACLLMALSVSRKGSKLEPDVLGSSTIRDTDGDGLLEIVDGWGTALAFFRFPAANWTDPTINALQQSFLEMQRTFAPAGSADELDPFATLLNPTWQLSYKDVYTQLFWSGTAGLDPLPASNPGKSGAAGLYMVPVLVSAGPDGQFGLDFLDARNATPNTMSVASATSAPQDYDNIYSFRLAFGKRGD